MNKQNLIKQLEHDLNNLGYKTYIYIDSQRFIIDDDILGMLLVIDLETTFITIYEWVDMKVIALVMQFKKQLEIVEGLN